MGWRPGVAVLHDGFGIDEAVRAQADWLAGAGYLALPVDLGFWGRPSAGLLRMSGDLRDGRPDLQPGRCGAGVAGEPARMRRAARRDRVLRHRRFRPAMAAGHGFSVSSLNYGLIRKNARTPCAGPARSWPASAAATPSCARRRSGRPGAAGARDRPRHQGVPDAGHAFLHQPGVSRAKSLASWRGSPAPAITNRPRTLHAAGSSVLRRAPENVSRRRGDARTQIDLIGAASVLIGLQPTAAQIGGSRT